MFINGAHYSRSPIDNATKKLTNTVLLDIIHKINYLRIEYV